LEVVMHLKFPRALGLLFVLALFLLPACAHAQFNASLSGSVLDSTRAAILGAKLR
jgi:hypothetical protein